MIIEHNGVKFIHDKNKSLVEIDTSINGIMTDKQFVILYSNFLEYLKHKDIRYFVLIKKNNDFELSQEYNNYRKIILIEDLLLKGIKQIFYMVSENKIEKYRKELPNHVHVVSDYNEINAIIENL